MKQNTLLKFLAAAGLSITVGLAQAGAVDALKKFNNDSDGISGSFSQTVKSKKKTQTTNGTFQILRPGLFKWEYTKPYKQTIVGDGKTIWLYDVDLAQVTKSAQDQTIGDSPAAILSNKTALDSSYALKEDGASNGISYVLATPKKNNAGYQYIRIGLKGRLKILFSDGLLLSKTEGNYITAATKTSSAVIVIACIYNTIAHIYSL